MSGFIEFLPVIINIISVIQIVSAGAMCIYGCKWRKGLIATLSIHIGIFLGVALAAILINQSYENVTIAVILIPVIAIVFYIFAYTSIALNHFLTGFLVGNKLAFMILYNLMESDALDFDIGVLLIAPLLAGLISGIIICCKFTHHAVLTCIVYIGAVEFVTGIFDIINKSLFMATGDISYIFDLNGMILKLMGAEVPSFWEVVFILLVGIFSFVFQKKQLEEKGIDLSNKIVDDRG